MKKTFQVMWFTEASRSTKVSIVEAESKAEAKTIMRERAKMRVNFISVSDIQVSVSDKVYSSIQAVGVVLVCSSSARRVPEPMEQTPTFTKRENINTVNMLHVFGLDSFSYKHTRIEK